MFGKTTSFAFLNSYTLEVLHMVSHRLVLPFRHLSEPAYGITFFVVVVALFVFFLFGGGKRRGRASFAFCIFLKADGRTMTSLFQYWFRSSRLQQFFKICVLKKFAMFTGKRLCWSFLLSKLQIFRPATF